MNRLDEEDRIRQDAEDQIRQKNENEDMQYEKDQIRQENEKETRQNKISADTDDPDWEIDRVFSTLNRLLAYEPASFEFNKNFDRAAAIELLYETCSRDNFFTDSMEYYEPDHYGCDDSMTDFNAMDNMTLFALLLWLKWYTNKRCIAISELHCYMLRITATGYRNIAHKGYLLSTPLSCNFNDEIIMTPYRLLVQRDFILPETIFFAKGDNILTLNKLLNLMSMYSDKTILLNPLIDNDVLSIVPKLNRVLSNRYFSTPGKAIVFKIKQSIDNIVDYIPDHREEFDYPERSRSELIMTSTFLTAFISMM